MICYDFNLNILRFDEEGDETETSLPFSIRKDERQTPQEIQAGMTEFFQQFMDLITSYDPDREGEYVWAGEFETLAIYEC